MDDDGPTVPPSDGATRSIDPDVVHKPISGGASARLPQQIGPYRILSVLGEGGFGVVYAAERREPIKQRVALKVIKPGMDSRSVIARFEQERQALAVMNHPNIAKVLDAGVTDESLGARPYFVMEHVSGEPITDYCDRHNLTLRQRLELFIPVCEAVQHAHHKGIIHRDLKPSNILVAVHEGRAVPKVIDFGVAKATAKTFTEATIFTEQGQLIGTPEYMSPEQAEMGATDIDTRTDVYSLGAVLYELLTGAVPFDSKSLRAAALIDVQRIIREVEPPKPSTRLSILGDTATRTAQQRHTDPKRLGMVLRGDLDWIVMKCLEKDRSRRYATANDLAADIQRHLGDEPVVAGPPSAGYRLAKFVRRNRGQVMGVSVVAGTLVLASGVSVAFGVLATRARDAMNEARLDLREALDNERDARTAAEANERRAVEEAERAERELARATEIKRLITGMFTGLSPEQARGADTTLLRTILDDTAERLARGEVSDELIAAELHHVVGDVYWALGRYPEGERHLPVALEIRTRELGESHPDTLDSMSALASLFADQGRLAEAEPLLARALEDLRRELGEEHPRTLTCMANLARVYARQGRYAEAEPLARQSAEIQRRILGDEHADTLSATNSLVALYYYLGRFAEAEPWQRRTLETQRRVLGDDHPDTVTSMSTLAIVCAQLGHIDEAERLFLEAIEAERRLLGEEHPEFLSLTHNVGVFYREHDRPTEAEPLIRRTLETRRRVLGDGHPDTLQSIASLASLYRAQSRYAEAEPLFVETMQTQRRVLGEEHRSTLGTTTNLGLLYNEMGRHGDAALMFETSLPIKRRVLGADHPWTRIAMEGLAAAYEHLGRAEEALQLRRELLALQTAGADAPEAGAGVLNDAALMLLTHPTPELRDPPRALIYAQRACAAEEAAGGSSLWSYLDTLARAQYATGDTAAAIQTQRRAISLMPTADADPGMQERLAEYLAAAPATPAPPTP